MDLNIKQKDCRFIIKPEDRMVICVLAQPCMEDAVMDYIDDNFDFPEMSLWAVRTSKFSELLSMPKCFIGKAVCAEEDEWNEETGKMIAYSRAKTKFYNSFYKRMNLFINKISNRLEEFMNQLNYMGKEITANCKRLDQAIEKRVSENE